MPTSILLKAVLAFFSTTMDDFAVMLVFFSRAQTDYPSDVKFGYLRVIAGQTIGFTIVVLISLMGMIVGLVVPEDYVDLIGFFPLVVGLFKAYEVIEEEGCCGLECCGFGGELAETVADGSKQEYEKLKQADDVDVEKQEPVFEEPISSYNNPAEAAAEPPSEDEPETNALADTVGTICQSCLDPFMLEVTTFALVCSSDNIAIYISLFASMKPWQVLFTIAMFYCLLFLNIVIAMLLMEVRGFRWLLFIKKAFLIISFFSLSFLQYVLYIFFNRVAGGAILIF
jgi:cadmium resistance protein CadD (predicted permease)